MQSSSKIVLPKDRQGEVRDLLEKEGFRFSSQEHAFWHAETDGIHVIFYKSGSVVLQGNAGLCGKWRERLTQGPDRDGTVLGLDESGKGDYFGPLVLAGAVVGSHNLDRVLKAGTADSKKISDAAVERIFRELSGEMIYRVRVIEPVEYNRLYQEHKNLNRLMVDEYTRLIARFGPKDYDRIILDRFSASDKQNDSIRNSVKKEMKIVVRAEENPAVALASVVARRHFLDWIRKRSEESGMEIPIGSGPLAGALFRKMKRSDDREAFLSLAKAHFHSGQDEPRDLF